MNLYLHCYKYTGQTDNGEKRTGMIIARSEILAVKQIMSHDITPTYIKQISDRRIFWLYQLGSWLRFRMSKKKFILWWTRELADLMRSGFSMRVAIESTIYKAPEWYYKLLLSQLYQDILAGASFSVATKKLGLFSKIENIVIATSEKNHRLAEGLFGMHHYLSQKGGHKIQQWLMAIPLLIAIMVVLFFSYYVANNILNIYIYDIWLQNRKINFISTLFMAIYSGKFIIKIIIIMGIGIMIKILYSSLVALPIKKIQYSREKFWLKIPFKRAAICQQYSIYLLSAISFAMHARLPLHQVFFQAAYAMPHHVFQKEIFRAASQIYYGYSLEHALLEISLLNAGERVILHTCLSNANVDKENIDHLLEYTYSQIKNFQTFMAKLVRTSLMTILAFLILFMLASTINIVFIEYI